MGSIKNFAIIYTIIVSVCAIAAVIAVVAIIVSSCRKKIKFSLAKLLVPLCIGLVFIIAGATVAGVNAKDGWTFFSGEFYTYRTTTLPESSYSSINFECSFADITVKQEGTEYSYTLPEQFQFSVTQSANGSTVSIRQKEKWFSFPFSFFVPEIILVIPENAAGYSLSLETDCGSITAKGLTGVDALEAQTEAGSITLEAVALSGRLKADSDAGSINISDVTAYNATVSADAGSISIRNGTFNSLNVESDAGKVTLADVSADSIQAKTEAGKVTLANVSADLIQAKTEAGSLNVEEIQSDKIILSTEAGSIKGTIAGVESEYSISIVQDLGSCNLRNRTGTTAKQLQIRTEVGSIAITFTK